MHRFIVAFAHLDQVPRQVAGLFLAMLDVFREIAAVAFQGVGVFVERLEQFQNFRQLLLRQLLFVGKVLQPHFFRAQFDQNLVQPRVVIHVFHAFLARDLVKRRLRDVNETLFDQLPASAGRKTSAAACGCASRPRPHRS